MRHIIRGIEWTQVSKRLKGHWGWCKPATLTIEIAKGQTGIRLLETLIHETLHAAYTDLSEDAVTETARDMALLLWKNGVRFADETATEG